MAFRQIIIDMDGFRATELLNITSLDYNPGTLWSRPFTDGTDLYSKATSENVPVTLFDTGIFKMVATLTDSLKHLNEKFYYNQNQIINNNSGNRYVEFTGFAFGVDDDTELGTLWICVTADGGEYGVTRLASPSHDLYLGILSAQPDPNKSGGAGSGYIGNSLLSNKKMVGYKVPESTDDSTKTESVNEASESPVSGKPKIGNGYARIRFVMDANYRCISQISNKN